MRSVNDLRSIYLHAFIWGWTTAKPRAVKHATAPPRGDAAPQRTGGGQGAGAPHLPHGEPPPSLCRAPRLPYGDPALPHGDLPHPPHGEPPAFPMEIPPPSLWNPPPPSPWTAPCLPHADPPPSCRARARLPGAPLVPSGQRGLGWWWLSREQPAAPCPLLWPPGKPALS